MTWSAIASATLLLLFLYQTSACHVYSVYHYERKPKDQAGSSLIGGCGGEKFLYHSYGSAVEHIKAWKGGASDGLKAIYFQTFDGQTFTIGQIPVGPPTKEFTFKVGERLKGNMILTGNGIGTRTGYIKFQTSLGNTFEVGNQKTNYIYDSKDSYLMGFFGTHGADVDTLGFLLMKELENQYLSDVDYELASVSLSQPIRFREVEFTNPHNVEDTVVERIEQEMSTTKEWSVAGSFSFTYSSSVEAGVPGAAETTTGWSISVGVTASYTNTKFESNVNSNEYTAVVPACSYGNIDWTYFESTQPVSFRGALVYEFKDGSTPLRIDVDGVYKGVITGTTVVDKDDIEYYKPGEAVCAPQTPEPTEQPTERPTHSPTSHPSQTPSQVPSVGPSGLPTTQNITTDLNKSEAGGSSAFSRSTGWWLFFACIGSFFVWLSS